MYQFIVFNGDLKIRATSEAGRGSKSRRETRDVRHHVLPRAATWSKGPCESLQPQNLANLSKCSKLVAEIGSFLAYHHFDLQANTHFSACSEIAKFRKLNTLTTYCDVFSKEGRREKEEKGENYTKRSESPTITTIVTQICSSFVFGKWNGM